MQYRIQKKTLSITNHGSENDKDCDFDVINTLASHSFEKRRIHITGDIDNILALTVSEELQYYYDKDKNSPVYLIINSSGGEVDAAWMLIEEMEILKKSGVVLFTIASGFAYSAAAAILACGTKGYRLIKPKSTIMLHPCSYSLSYDYSEYQDKIISFYKKNGEELNRIVANQCGKEYKQYLQDIDKSLWLTAEEAVKYGIVDGILDCPYSDIRIIPGGLENEKNSDKQGI